MFLDECRTLKWTNKVSFFMLGRLVLKAFILYSHHDHTSGQVKLKRRDFLIEAVEGLLGDLREPRRVGRPLVAVENRLVNAKEHFNISKLPKGKRRGCAVCSDRETKRVRTSYLCLTCDVGLCPVACWKDYHTKKVLRVQNELSEN